MKYLVRVVKECLIEFEIQDGERMLDHGTDMEDHLPLSILNALVAQAEKCGYKGPWVTGMVEAGEADPDIYGGEHIVMPEVFIKSSCENCRKYKMPACCNDVEDLTCWEGR